MEVYPLKMIPCFRYGEQTPWGGSALRDGFGKKIPDERTGESLEASVLPGFESRVENGELAGNTLAQVVGLWGKDLTGSASPDFPLLLKLIDAKETLSVQVHPGDDYAAAREGGKRGKTEAWVVLSAPPGARLVYGTEGDGQTLRDAMEENKIEASLRFVSALPGDVLYIPAGMVHALGGGIVVYEIQQSSDLTYRLWDWGRKGKDGKPRELHREKAFAVARPQIGREKLPGVTAIVPGGSQTCYISDANFELWRMNISGNMPLPERRMLLLTPLGECEIRWPGGTLPLRPLETALVPAALRGAGVSGRLPVLMSALPDPERVKALLGRRAEDVAGVSDEE